MTEILSKGVVRELGPNVSKDESKKARVQRCGMITAHILRRPKRRVKKRWWRRTVSHLSQRKAGRRKESLTKG